ncbi:MAG: hypothetical protein ACREHD_12440 [Pirellulales bacterium]
MKTVDIQEVNLEDCVDEAQQSGVLIMRNGAPAAIVLGIEGMDQEQVELGLSDRFWKLVADRRRDATLSRAELEKRISGQAG